MKHHFKYICYDIDELTSGVTKLRTFMSRLRKQAVTDPDAWDPDTYFGLGFEAMVESLINQMGSSPYIQLKDYTPVTKGDMGVDGVGYGPNGETHTVQVKARTNTDSTLTANRDHISNFVAHSLLKYGAETMTIITTASGLHEVISQDMYQGKVRTIGFEDLRRLVDNNAMFWSQFRDDLKYSE